MLPKTITKKEQKIRSHAPKLSEIGLLRTALTGICIKLAELEATSDSFDGNLCKDVRT